MELKVLYEDNHIIAVLKPAGVLSHGDMTGKPSIFDEVKNYLKEKYNKPGNVFLGLVHRLDKPVTGIMVFAKTSKGASRLSEQFRNHAIQKTYNAIVFGELKEKQGELKEKVSKVSFFAEGFAKKSDKEILEAVKKATKTRTAELSYKVVKSNGKYSLLEILPKTGRFHQIRIQMAELGHPILGDKEHLSTGRQDQKKGTDEWQDNNSIALCATGLSFKSATGDKDIHLKIDLPKDWEQYIK
ncbi:MAG: RluA family pseudouridine synthase [Candidatus Staskawiczbacteria bacterium]|nr:RluA family pseudouridine synthase [Candidatus Staskawiczbacteria bacterium]